MRGRRKIQVVAAGFDGRLRDLIVLPWNGPAV
jgi:hypothetical protein